jgi:hypothetical protein
LPSLQGSLLLLHFDVELYIIFGYDMDIVLDNRDNQAEDGDEMIPFFSIASRDFDKDLAILKKSFTSV